MAVSPKASGRPQRRTQAQRTQQTQERLVRSAIELLKKHRYAGLRTSDVAQEAGVSKGAATHHFPTKDSLVLRALEEMYRHTQERALHRLASAGSNTEQLLEAMVEDSKAFFLSDDFLLSLDLLMFDPDSQLGVRVKELARMYRLPVEKEWVDALRGAGHRRTEAENVVRLTFALARGFGIRQLISGHEAAADSLMETWLLTARSLLNAGKPSTSPRLRSKDK